MTDAARLARVWAPPATAALVLALAATQALVSTGTTLGDALRYLLVWAVLIAAPGVLLWRALVGRSSTEVELGGGIAVGLAVLLVSWLVATGLGHGAWAGVVPAVVVVAFVAVPRLRPCWRSPPAYAGASRLAWWSSMTVLGLLAVHKIALISLRPTPLPPGPSTIASDAWYGLGIAQQLAVGFPVADPTFAGGEIRYHWFGLGIITATAQLARTDLTASVLHLWLVPFVVAWLLVTSALVRALLRPYATSHPATGWWCWGPLAALLVVVCPASIVLTRSSVPGLGTGLNSSSASGAFASLFVSAAGIIAATLLRDGRRPGAWVVAALLAVASSGIKPTVLPVVAAGWLLVGVWKLLHRVRGWSVALVAAVGVAVVFSVASRIVIGSATGTKIQPFAIVVADPAYRLLYAPARPSAPGAGGSVLPAIADGRPGAVGFVLTVLLLFLLAQAVPLLGIGRAFVSVWRRDPAVVWVAGVVLSGYAASYLIAHSGFSQQWFGLNATGTGIALAVAVVATEVRGLNRWLVGGAAAAVVLGAVVSIAWRRWSAVPEPGATVAPLPLAPGFRLIAFGTLALALVGLLVALRLLRRPGRPTVAPVLVAAALLVGAVLPASTWLLRNDPIAITSNPGATVSAPQQQAAVWLREHSRPTDVVVSNIFCRPVLYRDGCDHSTVWVSALTGRRLVLDGWAYIPQTMAAYDGSRPGTTMPSPFPDRLRDSLALVSEGDRKAACRLTTQFGARWVYADTDATPVSKKLKRFAHLRESVGTVRVYEIDPSRLSCPGT